MVLVDKSKPNHQHCRYCGKEIPLGRYKFCSPECAKKWRLEYIKEWQRKKMKKTNYQYLKKWKKENPEKVKVQYQRWIKRKKGDVNNQHLST